MFWLFQGIYSNITLRSKILLLNALVIISSLSILAYLSTRISSDAIIAKAEKSSVREVELIESSLDTFIRSAEDYSKVVATNDKLQGYLMSIFLNSFPQNNANKQVSESIDVLKIGPEMFKVLNTVLYPNTQIFASVVFVDKQKVYSDRVIDEESFREVIRDDFLDAAFERQTPVWSDILNLKLNDGTRENVFAVAKLVIDLDTGNKTGVVVLFVKEKDMAGIYTEKRMGQINDYYILNAAGRVISSQSKKDLNKDITDVMGLRGNQSVELDKTGSSVIGLEGKKVLLCVQRFEKLDWRIISTVPLDDITRESSNIRKVIFIIGILCLLLAFAFSYLISYTVTRPIQKLTKTMKLIMGGDMDVRVDVESSSEIGILTQGFNNLMDKIQSLLRDIVAEQRIKQEFEFKLIQSQIKPHFLYNSLETILSLNKLERHREAMQVTKSLADFYRLSLSKGNDIIRVSDEIQLTRDYLYIQKHRYSQYMDFSFDVREDIMDFYVPKLTLQPLVENSIYHGLKYKNEIGKLEIKGYMEDGRVVLMVWDNGVGMGEDKILHLLDSRTSRDKEDFGLGSIDRRIKLLYGAQYGLEIQSEEGEYTQVMVTIPALRTKG